MPTAFLLLQAEMIRFPTIKALVALCVILPFGTFAQDAGQIVAAPAVTVVEVTTRDFVARASVSGSVIPRQSVAVVPQITGATVTTLNVDIGDTIVAGDVLATFDDATLAAQLSQVDAQIETANAAIRQAQSQIASAQANADEANTVLVRTQTLVADGATARSALDQAQATDRTARAALTSAHDGLLSAQSQLRQIEAQRAVARLNLDHASLTAPVSGVIATRNINLGDLASGASPAFVIYKDGALEVSADVVETALSQITIGDGATLSISGLPDITGTVRLISPNVDATTRLGTVYITPTATQNLRAGIFAGGWIITDQRSGLSVPTTAIQTDADGSYVFVVNDGQLTKTAVTAGLIWEGQREVISGLTEGQTVVARAGSFFVDGDRVTPITAEAQP